MRKTILLRSKNRDATEYYYNIIKKSLMKISDNIEDVFEGDSFQAKRDDLIVVGSCLSFIRMWISGYRNIITWFQGTLPEESYMRNQSNFRKKMLELIEMIALKKSTAVIFVSNAMKTHYEDYYRINVESYYIMPCFNTSFTMPHMGDDTRYQKAVFAYVGGLGRWQCIRETMALYKEIEKQFEGKSSLLILTSQKEEARKMVEGAGIRNCTIKTVHYSEIPQELQHVSFGFNLRQDNIVNRIATPTKLANYVANGVIPIVSDCVKDFVDHSTNNPYVVVVDDMDNTTKIVDKIKRMIDLRIYYTEVYQACKQYFVEYYNADYHVKNLADKLEEVFS